MKKGQKDDGISQLVRAQVPMDMGTFSLQEQGAVCPLASP